MSALPASLPGNPGLLSIGDRFTAQFIDALAGLAVGGAVYLLVEPLGLPKEGCFLGWLVYVLACDGLPRGQSLGKRFTRSAVIHIETGQPCNYWRSVLRKLSLLVLGIFDVVFIMGSSRRRLGDCLAGTRVVRLS